MPAVVATVAQIAVFPLKGAGGVTPDHWPVSPSGLRHDRTWMVVTPDGRFVSRRNCVRMTLVRTRPTRDGIVLEAPQAPPLAIPTPAADAPTRTAQIWGDPVVVRHAGHEADAWLEAVLGLRCHLTYMPPRPHRLARPPQWPVPVRLVDRYPLHLVSTDSIDDLGQRMGRPVEAARFRANLVVTPTPGGTPFAEDAWRQVRIGEVPMAVAAPCARCRGVDVAPTQPETDAAVLRTLASFRRREGKVLFGLNLVPETPGVLRVGDPVVVTAADAA